MKPFSINPGLNGSISYSKNVNLNDKPLTYCYNNMFTNGDDVITVIGFTGNTRVIKQTMNGLCTRSISLRKLRQDKHIQHCYASCL